MTELRMWSVFVIDGKSTPPHIDILVLVYCNDTKFIVHILRAPQGQGDLRCAIAVRVCVGVSNCLEK